MHPRSRGGSAFESPMQASIVRERSGNVRLRRKVGHVEALAIGRCGSSTPVRNFGVADVQDEVPYWHVPMSAMSLKPAIMPARDRCLSDGRR